MRNKSKEMPKMLSEELVVTYVTDFIDFTEELPNDLSPLISQSLELDSRLKHQIDKIERKMEKLSKSKHFQHKIKHTIRIKRYMKRIRKISYKKLNISAKIKELIEAKVKRFSEHNEGLLLSNQTESLTYGTRSGKMWTNTHSNQ